MYLAGSEFYVFYTNIRLDPCGSSTGIVKLQVAYDFLPIGLFTYLTHWFNSLESQAIDSRLLSKSPLTYTTRGSCRTGGLCVRTGWRGACPWAAGTRAGAASWSGCGCPARRSRCCLSVLPPPRFRRRTFPVTANVHCEWSEVLTAQKFSL